MAPRATPWDQAHEAARASGVQIAPLTELDDALRVAAIIDAVWGEQTIPPELLRAFQHAGAVLLGAQREGRLIGFVFGFLGFAGGIHVHSHMLAVLPEHQTHGVGYALKLGQRAAALDAGVEEVRWTFDPLVARNARFNLVKLGARAVRFMPAFYGEMKDRLNRGDRSDRFEVRWPLRSPPVERAAAGGGEALAPAWAGPVLLSADGDGPLAPPRPTDLPAARGARVCVPSDHLALRTDHPELGREWREAATQAFVRCFDAGLIAVSFTADGCYVFDADRAT